LEKGGIVDGGVSATAPHAPIDSKARSSPITVIFITVSLP